jgi:hypothetical protein
MANLDLLGSAALRDSFDLINNGTNGAPRSLKGWYFKPTVTRLRGPFPTCSDPLACRTSRWGIIPTSTLVHWTVRDSEEAVKKQ